MIVPIIVPKATWDHVLLLVRYSRGHEILPGANHQSQTARIKRL